jgi:hypothetical protein
MRKGLMLAFVAGGVLVVAPMTHAIGIGAKHKAKKVQGNLVQAYNTSLTGPGTGDDEGDSPAILAPAVPRSGCTFDSGKFKLQVGKDATVKMKGVQCGGTPFTGTLCAHSKILATIMDEEIDKEGTATPVMCNSTAGDIAGNVNFVTGNIGTLTCTAGSCEGTMPVVTTDPCPGVDKVAEVRRFEVFDGPDMASSVVMGTSIAACCGPTQTFVGPLTVSGTAPCNTSTQDVLAEMGTVTQGVAP